MGCPLADDSVLQAFYSESFSLPALWHIYYVYIIDLELLLRRHAEENLPSPPSWPAWAP